jgi:hypothetical protein
MGWGNILVMVKNKIPSSWMMIVSNWRRVGKKTENIIQTLAALNTDHVHL